MLVFVGLSVLWFFSLFLISFEIIPHGVRLSWFFYSRWRQQWLKKQYEEQWPDALLLMSSALQAGLTLDQSIQVLLTQSPQPLRQHLAEKKTLSADLSSTQKWQQLFSDPTHAFLRESGMMAQTLGAPYAKILSTYARQWRTKQLFQKKVSGLTAQSRMTAKMLVMAPLILGAGLSVLAPEFVHPLFESSLGRFLLLTVVGLNLLGFWVIQKMMRSVLCG